MDDDDEIVALYRAPEAGAAHPAEIAARLVVDEEHEHLADADVVSIAYLMRHAPLDRGGKRVLGAVHVPGVQGKLSDLFDQLLVDMLGSMPDFLVILDAEWWAEASEREREALLWHELAHIKPAVDKFGAPRLDRDGVPVMRLVEHDVAAFRSEVARYGAWSPDLQEFLAAARRD